MRLIGLSGRVSRREYWSMMAVFLGLVAASMTPKMVEGVRHLWEARRRRAQGEDIHWISDYRRFGTAEEIDELMHARLGRRRELVKEHAHPETRGDQLREALPTLVGLALLPSSISLEVRRLRDAGYSPHCWWWEMVPGGTLLNLYRCTRPTAELHRRG